LDETKRMITKIARESQRFSRLVLSGSGLGLTEHEFIHIVNKRPGISQEEVSRKLGKDKAAVTRMTQNLERKGYVLRSTSEIDKRQKCLFVTEKAKLVKNTATKCEAFFYHFLTEDIVPEEKEVFLRVLEQIYRKSKTERQSGFAGIDKLWSEENESFEL